MLVRHFLDEYARYRALGERAMAQLTDADLNHIPVADGNSIVMIVRHMSGNLRSRFTDFLTADGEKPWREREDEFANVTLSRAELERDWNAGFDVLFHELEQMRDEDLQRMISIRGVELNVHEALCRSLAHVSMHMGQIILLAKIAAGSDWKTLTIARGQSAAYNANPTLEKGAAYAAAAKKSQASGESK